MSSTEIPDIEAPLQSRQKTSSSSVGTSQFDEIRFPAADQKILSSHEIGTDVKGKNFSDHLDAPSPIDRIYPHLFDDCDPSGEARAFVASAILDAQNALEAFGSNELQDLGTQLPLIANAMRKAHSLTTFNESYGAVTSFIRRATIAALPSELSRGALNALISVLHSLSINPMIDLEDAVGLIDTLSAEGWQGEHGAAKALVSALFEEIDSELAPQSWLFEDIEMNSERG